MDRGSIRSYYDRPTLKASCKEMDASGESVGYLYYIDKEAIGIRHLIPLLFITCILIGFVLSFIWNPFCCLLIGGLTIYFIAAVIAAISATTKNRKCTLPLFILFFSVHVSYGIGTIFGLTRGRKIHNR